MQNNQAVFLDRDNTINDDPGYLSDPAAVHLLPGAIEGLRMLQAHGFQLVLISNQSGVGRGYYSQADLDAVHARLVQLLAEGDVQLDGAYYCTHTPSEHCDCRKPLPGMIVRAAADLGLDPERSYMVGDKVSDVEAGRAAGCATVLIRADDGALPPSADVACADLVAAAHWIIARA